MSVCLGIDIGASGGRHILGKIVDGKLSMREVYRFENGAEMGLGGKAAITGDLDQAASVGSQRCLCLVDPAGQHEFVGCSAEPGGEDRVKMGGAELHPGG